MECFFYLLYAYSLGPCFLISRLIEAKAVVFECGPNCGCGPACVNRTSQRGLKFRLEVALISNFY